MSLANPNNLQEKFKPVLQDILRDTLEHADFTYADLGDDGIQLVCEAVKSSKHLKSLKLQRNKLSDKGANILLDAVLSGGTISALYLQDNMITDKFVE